MFTYISIEEFADGVVKNNKDTNRKELIASLREALAAKKSGARCMICGAPIWAAGSGVTGTYLCFTCTTGCWGRAILTDNSRAVLSNCQLVLSQRPMCSVNKNTPTLER